MRCSNFILWLIPAVLLGSCSNKTEKKDAPSIKVSTEILAKDNACLTTTFVGQAEAASTSAVSFPTAGTILKVTVNEGQEVRKGQLLAEIDPSTMRKALKSAEAVLAQARDAYDRMKFLHDTNSLPEIQWVEAQSKLAQAQAAYDIANKNLNDCRLYSPVNGTIGQKMVQAGETVMPGQPIVTIVDINTVKVNVSLSKTMNPSQGYHKEIVRSIIKAILLEMLSNMESDQCQSVEGESKIQFQFNRFLQMLSNEDIKHRPIDFYADKLCLSAKYLSVICTKVSGKSARQWIDEYTVEDIRYHLFNTDYSIKEIAYRLGFENLSFFGKYVKRHFGKSPSELRTARNKNK